MGCSVAYLRDNKKTPRANNVRWVFFLRYLFMCLSKQQDDANGNSYRYPKMESDLYSVLYRMS